MKLPISWLREYVDIDCSIEELEEKLFSCGFEVEEVIKVGEKIDKIVTCKIIEIEKHPNADKLSVCKVDVGKYGVLQIITAAKNVFVGAVVPVALDGSTLASGDHIFNGELRGLPSYGMFCSGEELGITDDWYKGASVNGILILDDNFPLGESVKELLEIEDVVFDINVTANRPDCNSILGLAREVSAVLNKPLKMPDFTFNCDASISTKNTVKVENLQPDLCQRYISHLVKDIKIEESPTWLKRRLFSMGLRSINNIVDITNYVLLEIGQPMHAFDLSHIDGNKIVIRKAKNGEKIVTLDEKEFALSDNNLLICDSVKGVAIAGVMGGLNSEIKETTKDVLFESAKFSRDNIRKTSRTIGQRSDSSSRYEKGVDYLSVELGMKRALNLIDRLNCGKIACDEYDLVDKKLEEKVIKTTLSKVNGVLGIDVPKDVVVNILSSLSFKVKTDGDNLEVTVPLFREDMEDYPDIAEEIIREYGYSKIEPSLLKTSSITNGGRNEMQTKTEDLKNLVCSMGFNEIITYSFVPEKDINVFGLENYGNYVKIMNPLSEDVNIMRVSLIPSIVRTALNNLNRKNNEGRLFELAKVYNLVKGQELPKEKANLSLAVYGENEDFYTLKGAVEEILEVFCNGASVNYEVSDKKFMHPTRSANVIINDKEVGVLGQLHPTLASSLGIDKTIYVAELSFDDLVCEFNDKVVYAQISKFPNIERDLALILDENVKYSDVVKVIKANGGEFLRNVSLFDIYQGDQIAKGKKSMAFNLNFVSNERTLSVEEIDQTIKNILDDLSQKLGAVLR
jgi:phenylalanyl-tRNA synthetase beta chain